jgi:hypothetical protein
MYSHSEIPKEKTLYTYQESNHGPRACILAELDAAIKFRKNPFGQREDVSSIPNKKQKEILVIMGQ